jgi:hypothetical protein
MTMFTSGHSEDSAGSIICGFVAEEDVIQTLYGLLDVREILVNPGDELGTVDRIRKCGREIPLVREKFTLFVHQVCQSGHHANVRERENCA